MNSKLRSMRVARNMLIAGWALLLGQFIGRMLGIAFFERGLPNIPLITSILILPPFILMLGRKTMSEGAAWATTGLFFAGACLVASGALGSSPWFFLVLFFVVMPMGYWIQDQLSRPSKRNDGTAS